MDLFTTMADQLQAPPQHAPAAESDNKTGRLRQLLRDNGQQTARELAAAAGLSNRALVGALLKHDIRAGRVRSADGYYSWNLDAAEAPAQPRRVRDVLDWHEVADDDFPDADLTVIVRMRDNEEPVWLGFWDGEEWRDTDGQPIDVVRWADMPQGGEDT